MENLVMEGPDIVLWPEFFLCAGAKLEDLQLAEFIGQRLAGNRDVTVSLCLDVWLVLIGVLAEIRDHLVAGPVFVVDAGIKHQAASAQQFIRQPAVITERVLIKANILAEA